MVSYEPMYKTMKHNNITTYKLITVYGLSSRTISNLKNNKSITMHTLEKLCRILNCTPNEIVKFTD